MNLSKFLINKKTATLNQPAIILSVTPSPWGSCRIITPNLQKTYELLFPKANFFSYYPEMNDLEILFCAKKILDSNPTHIVFADHLPHPLRLIEALSAVKSQKLEIPTFFHIYGDLTISTSDWKKCENLLKKMNVRFICASKAEANLLSQFLRGKKSISICPFPVSSSDYHHSPAAGTAFRKKHGLSPQSYIVTYAGRISLQKNVHVLISEFSKATEKNPNAQLILAGDFDNIGAPLFGYSLKIGSYQKKILELIQKINERVGHRKINYIGTLMNKRELLGLYNASDLYCSLSTYHDEDYGMAPIEALFCGCPTLLTGWGGYLGFEIADQYAQFIPVTLHRQGLSFESKHFELKLKSYIQNPFPTKKRRKVSQSYQDFFSIQASASYLDKIINSRLEKFSGFSQTFESYNERLRMYKGGVPIYPEGPSDHGIYYKLYKGYTLA